MLILSLKHFVGSMFLILGQVIVYMYKAAETVKNHEPNVSTYRFFLSGLEGHELLTGSL